MSRESHVSMCLLYTFPHTHPNPVQLSHIQCPLNSLMAILDRLWLRDYGVGKRQCIVNTQKLGILRTSILMAISPGHIPDPQVRGQPTNRIKILFTINHFSASGTSNFCSTHLPSRRMMLVAWSRVLLHLWNLKNEKMRSNSNRKPWCKVIPSKALITCNRTR